MCDICDGLREIIKVGHNHWPDANERGEAENLAFALCGIAMSGGNILMSELAIQSYIAVAQEVFPASEMIHVLRRLHNTMQACRAYWENHPDNADMAARNDPQAAKTQETPAARAPMAEIVYGNTDGRGNN